ncbi:MAG: glucose-6-phosphate isomerase [Porphyromonas sp.]|nr:glucose-6-phosphate isomerase [Porphyromonas sp.]
MSNEIKLNISNALVSEGVRESYQQLLETAGACNKALHDGSRPGNDFLGWVSLPSSITEEFVQDIQATADRLNESCEYVIAIGIGGSYLGAKAVIDALSDSFAQLKPAMRARLLYAGHNIGEDYLYELMELVRGHKFGIINISKSGTTTEPAMAFRLLKQMLEEQEGVDFARKHIVAITDAKKGALRNLADKEGYTTYVIPDDVGGRFSVLTAVGLLPIAVAGLDIAELVNGAKEMERLTSHHTQSPEENIACQYAAARNALYLNGKKIEILVNFHSKLHYINEWWKQLYGESEGKEGKGIFPTGVDFSTDLHSMGQWIQQGERTIFETFISIAKPNHEVKIPMDDQNLDGLNYIAGKNVDYINHMAERGTLLAHLDGGVPVIHIELPVLSEYTIGSLLYFFEKAVGISGYLLGVNPFNQPGVEDYKRNMFALLEKPGFEEATEQIKNRMKQM